jgi:release factor glutamine methyltransferase
VLADPREAVFGGVDGLDLMAVVVSRAALLLRPGGVFAMEHDDSHDRSVPALVEADGRFTDVADHRDLAGRPRYVTATRG